MILFSIFHNLIKLILNKEPFSPAHKLPPVIDNSAYYRNLLNKEILIRAWKKVRANKGQPGIDKITIAQYERKLEKNLYSLFTRLRAKKYRFKPIIRFEVKTKKGKTRHLSLLTVEDKIVQSALLFIIEPEVERILTKACFGFRTGLGIPDAVKAVTNARQNGFHWGIKADVASFFDSINRPLLFKMVDSVICDKDITELIRNSVCAPVIDQKGNLLEVEMGVPQGAVISPILSNIYLNEFDRAMARRDRKIIRYSDDFIIFCNKPESIPEVIEDSIKVLGRLHLRIKNDFFRHIDFRKGFVFLGYGFRGKIIELKK